jgi:hypothetical protein
MRVRCSFCEAEYETPVSATALLLVDRCERCGRAGLRPVDGDDGEPGPPGGAGGPPHGNGPDWYSSRRS